MHVGISAERLSHLIGAIYDCVIAPERWDATLDAICAEFRFANAILGVNAMPLGNHAIHASARVDAEELVQAAKFGPETVALWGGAGRLNELPLDEPVIRSQVTDPATWKYNRYYREWVEPRGNIDAVAIGVAKDPLLVGTLGLGRHRSAGAVDEAAIAGLRLIAPHIRRAVTISGLFDLKAIQASTFAATIDAIKVGVVLVDERGAIIHANAAALAMLEAGDPIQSRQRRVALRHPTAQKVLEAAVRQAARDEAGLGQRGIAIPARRSSGDSCVVHVMPLRRGSIRPGLMQRAAVALFVAPTVLPPQMPSDALMLLYDLTPAETRIFELICEGRTQAEVAATLAIAPSTVKTHLLHVFAKTGCQRQVDLVKLAASLTLPL